MGLPNGSVVKNPSVMQELQETEVQSLGQEDPLEKEMATHSSVLPWKSHGWRSLTGTVHVVTKELNTTDQLNNKNTS